MRTLDLNAISQQLLSWIQPLLARTGDLVGTLAGGAVQVFGWTLFILTVSYFVMVESNGLREDLVKIEIPGYTEDLRRLGNELSRIWNAFLRGQIIIFLLAVVIYSILLLLGCKVCVGSGTHGRAGQVPALYRPGDHLGGDGSGDILPAR